MTFLALPEFPWLDSFLEAMARSALPRCALLASKNESNHGNSGRAPFFSFKHSLLLLLAVASSVGSMLLMKHAQPPSLPQLIDRPDSSMENVIATVFNKQGTPILKIKSPKMIHYANHDTTYITRPRVTLYRQSPQPWYIDSEYATATEGITQIVFSKNVIIHHPFDSADPSTTMKTTSLTVFPNLQQATTREAVTIMQPDAVVRAVGMFADLNAGTVKLLSHATGDYVPTS